MHLSNRALTIAALGLTLISGSPAQSESRPGVEVFRQAMTQGLEKLRPGGFTQRDVRFVSVQPGGESTGAYAFKTSILIRDYGPGFPKNGYFGETCVRKLSGVYKLIADGAGGWRIDGRMTSSLADDTCKKNPAAAVSSMPIELLEGLAASAGAPAAAPSVPREVTAAPKGGDAGSLALGEWSCIGSGGRALIGLGFKVLSGGAYADLDGRNRGTYSLSGGKLVFAGGHLDGQVGQSRGGRTYRIKTADCEPYR